MDTIASPVWVGFIVTALLALGQAVWLAKKSKQWHSAMGLVLLLGVVPLSLLVLTTEALAIAVLILLTLQLMPFLRTASLNQASANCPMVAASDSGQTDCVTKASGMALPALIWLTGLYWVKITELPDPLSSVLLAAITVGLLLQILGTFVASVPVLGTNRWLSRSVLMAILGWLGMQIVIDSVLLAQKLEIWACVFALGAFLAPILLVTDTESASESHSSTLLSTRLPQALLVIGITGIATLVASRLTGSLGWLVVAAGFLSAFRPAAVLSKQTYGWLILAVTFLLGRTLLQTFLYQFNPNVTGINITHPYAGAALFLGLSLPVVYRQLKPAMACPFLKMVWVLLTVVILPCALNYFLHAEAAGAFLVSLLTASLVISVFANSESTAEGLVSNHASALQLALMTTSVSLVSSSFLDAGESAAKSDKLIVVGVLAIILLVLSAIARFKKHPETCSPT